MVPQRTSIVLDGRLTGKNMSQFFCVFNKSLVATMHPDTVYDITFHINQQPYQLQHQALDFVYDHNLFPLLIRNPMYFYQSEYNDSDDHLPPLTYVFACHFIHCHYHCPHLHWPHCAVSIVLSSRPRAAAHSPMS